MKDLLDNVNYPVVFVIASLFSTVLQKGRNDPPPPKKNVSSNPKEELPSEKPVAPKSSSEQEIPVGDGRVLPTSNSHLNEEDVMSMACRLGACLSFALRQYSKINTLGDLEFKSACWGFSVMVADLFLDVVDFYHSYRSAGSRNGETRPFKLPSMVSSLFMLCFVTDYLPSNRTTILEELTAESQCEGRSGKNFYHSYKYALLLSLVTLSTLFRYWMPSLSCSSDGFNPKHAAVSDADVKSDKKDTKCQDGTPRSKETTSDPPCWQDFALSSVYLSILVAWFLDTPLETSFTNNRDYTSLCMTTMIISTLFRPASRVFCGAALIFWVFGGSIEQYWNKATTSTTTATKKESPTPTPGNNPFVFPPPKVNPTASSATNDPPAATGEEIPMLFALLKTDSTGTKDDSSLKKKPVLKILAFLQIGLIVLSVPSITARISASTGQWTVGTFLCALGVTFLGVVLALTATTPVNETAEKTIKRVENENRINIAMIKELKNGIKYYKQSNDDYLARARKLNTIESRYENLKAVEKERSETIQYLVRRCGFNNATNSQLRSYVKQELDDFAQMKVVNAKLFSTRTILIDKYNHIRAQNEEIKNQNRQMAKVKHHAVEDAKNMRVVTSDLKDINVGLKIDITNHKQSIANLQRQLALRHDAVENEKRLREKADAIRECNEKRDRKIIDQLKLENLSFANNLVEIAKGKAIAEAKTRETQEAYTAYTKWYNTAADKMQEKYLEVKDELAKKTKSNKNWQKACRDIGQTGVTWKKRYDTSVNMAAGDLGRMQKEIDILKQRLTVSHKVFAQKLHAAQETNARIAQEEKANAEDTTQKGSTPEGSTQKDSTQKDSAQKDAPQKDSAQEDSPETQTIEVDDLPRSGGMPLPDSRSEQKTESPATGDQSPVTAEDQPPVTTEGPKSLVLADSPELPVTAEENSQSDEKYDEEGLYSDPEDREPADNTDDEYDVLDADDWNDGS